jgi:phage N-6-adenine-methyltransferase
MEGGEAVKRRPRPAEYQDSQTLRNSLAQGLPMTAARFMPEQKPGRSAQEVGTPRAFLDAVEKRFGPLKWDLAADESNHVTERWFGPGAPGEDSLTCSWWMCPPGLLWLNPPYGNIGPWAAKCASIVDPHRIAFLVPASVGSNWFAEHVDGKALVLFLRPRLTFVGHTQSYPKDLILAVYGEKPGYECWRWRGSSPSTGDSQ